jgi:non-reducing end alpha-L-arabinofuranosidase
MNSIRSVIAFALACAPVSVGAFVGGCWSYEASGNVGGAGGTGATGGSGGTGGTMPGSGGSGGAVVVTPGTLPCDVLEGAGHPCVAAHSTVRVLVRGYGGPLYQVRKPDMTTLDIGSVDGYADAAAQKTFCAGSTCVISLIYDQAPFANHLAPAPPGGANAIPGRPAPADRLELTANGHSVFGILFRPGEGYRAFCYACPYPANGVSGTAVGDEPQTIYMVSSQKELINGCCFDYGNAEYTANNDREGTMEAVYLGKGVIWGSGVQGGPWVMADLENGLYAGWERMQDRNISTALPLKYDYVTAMLVGDTAEKNGGKGRFALYGGDATVGPVTTMYDGIRPEKIGYNPMKKQGSIILSIGGDNSDYDGGHFYEGVMANGAASKATIDALQETIVLAGYGK